jgi:hypothetical protein
MRIRELPSVAFPLRYIFGREVIESDESFADRDTKGDAADECLRARGRNSGVVVRLCPEAYHS